MARAGIREREKQAAAARARMAKRGKRAKFWKENKKRLTLITLACIAAAFLAVFTPLGPDYYYATIQQNKFSSRGQIAPGTFKSLYNLGTFYANTLRKDKALECYDEILEGFYNFKAYEFGENADKSMEKYQASLRDVERGLTSGPPFRVPDSELPYVGYAIFSAAETMMAKGAARSFPQRLISQVYLNDFYVRFPEACDAKITDQARKIDERLTGRR